MTPCSIPAKPSHRKASVLLLGALAVLLACPLKAETDHQRLVQDLAHYGAGSIVASCVGGIIKLDPDYRTHPWQNLLVQTMTALAVNHMYEMATEKPWQIALERDLCAVAGAGVISWQVNF